MTIAVQGNNNWPPEKLENLCAQITDGKHGDCQDEPNSGFYFLSCKDVANGKLNYEGAREITEADYLDTHRRTKFSPADILITNSGTIGRMAIAPDNVLTRKTTFQKSVAILKPVPGRIESRYLYYALQADLQRLIEFAGGTAQKNLLLRDLRSFEVRVPPLLVQRRIAGILSAYDGLIENNQRRIKILEEMARSLYREWFVHFRFPGHDKVKMVSSPLGPIPQGWEMKKLVDITTFLSRGISPSYDDLGDSIVINQKCIRDHRLSLDQARRQTKPIPLDKLVRFGDVLINSTGVGTLGRVAQVYEDMEQCTVDSHVSILRPNSDTDVDFFGCALLLKQETFERLGVGATGQTELGRPAIEGVEIPVPPVSLQKQFGALIRPTRTVVIMLTKQCENLRRTRDLLLPRLLSGQVALTS